MNATLTIQTLRGQLRDELGKRLVGEAIYEEKIDALSASLRDMLEIYWGDGDGQLPEPTCIQNARAALELAGAK